MHQYVSFGGSVANIRSTSIRLDDFPSLQDGIRPITISLWPILCCKCIVSRCQCVQCSSGRRLMRNNNFLLSIFIGHSCTFESEWHSLLSVLWMFDARVIRPWAEWVEVIWFLGKAHYSSQSIDRSGKAKSRIWNNGCLNSKIGLITSRSTAHLMIPSNSGGNDLRRNPTRLCPISPVFDVSKSIHFHI